MGSYGRWARIRPGTTCIRSGAGDRGRAAAGGDRAGGDARPDPAVARQPHRSDSPLLPTGRLNSVDTYNPARYSRRHPAPALRPRFGAWAVAGFGRGEGRNLRAVLAEAGGAGGLFRPGE